MEEKELKKQESQLKMYKKKRTKIEKSIELLNGVSSKKVLRVKTVTNEKGEKSREKVLVEMFMTKKNKNLLKKQEAKLLNLDKKIKEVETKLAS